MSPGWISVLAVLLVASAGCVTQAPGTPGSTSQPTNAPTATAAGGNAAATASAEALEVPGDAEPLLLYLDASLKLQAEAPASEGKVTLPMPVNSPETFDFPVWNGTLTRAVNLSGRDVKVVFYVTSSSASLAANTLPPFADAPMFQVGLTLGDVELTAEVEGPILVHATEVATVEATLRGRGEAPAGAPVAFWAGPLYTHVQAVAEFQYVLGPDYPAHVELPA